MIYNPLQILFRKCIFSPKSIDFYRHIRSIVPRGAGPKRVEAVKIKTLTEYDESEPTFESYADFIKSLRKSKLGDELEVEKEFLSGDFYGDTIERCDRYYNMHLSEEKEMRCHIKKKIISRKYFNIEKETNLLTHAAKEQIKFLHKSNPTEWNCKALSECFSISEAGVKKLLKCNWTLTCPEKIKLHDEAVAKRWEILKSGKPSTEIYPLTQKLYKEGKLIDDYFSGNPNLPAVPPPSKKIIERKKDEEVGEYSAIVKTYLDYQKQKLIGSSKENSTETQISLTHNRVSIMRRKKDMMNTGKYKYVDEHDDDDAEPQVSTPQRYKYKDFNEIPFSQFKEILKEETSRKLKSKYKNEYDDFVMQETSKKDVTSCSPSKQPLDAKSCFVEIPKYKTDKLDLMYERNKDINTAYKYDEKLGYQYPVGKNIKGKIKVPPKIHNEKKKHKVGKCVYDDDGEFLYRVP